MKRKNRIPLRMLSLLLVFLLLSAVMPLQTFAESVDVADTSAGSNTFDGSELTYTEEQTPEDEDCGELFLRGKDLDLASVAAGVWDGASVYDADDGVIYIANYNQLSQIGTGSQVKSTDTNASTFGHGDPVVLSGSGTAEDPYVYLTYSDDAVYYLTNDIPLPSRTAWSVPSGFKGYFTSAGANGEDNSVLRTADTRLYQSGKVYYHNVFPMAESAGAAIHNNDYDVMDYGNGGLYGRSYLSTHNYVLAENFTAKTTFDVTEYITLTDDQNQNYQAIVIRSYDQLKLVGLGESTLKTDTINGITRTQTVTYPSDAVYYLNNDITLADDGWQLPADFSGSFTCDPTNRDSDKTRLYTGHTTGADVYIQNIYQLEMLGLSDDVRSEEPVLDRDYDPAYFGAGAPVYLTNLSNYLTYEKASVTGNTCILSRTFSNARVDQVSTTALGMISNTDHIDGRDWFGQTTVEIDGTTYILIGDRQQLDAIGTDKYVYGPVYAVTQRRSSITDAWQIDSSSISLVYPGDADLIADVAVSPDGTNVRDFSESPLFSASAYHSLGTQRNSSTERVVYCASDGSGGFDVRATASTANRGVQRYSKDANYIVFRDIDMLKTDKTDKNWQPLMFSGTMYGAKAEAEDADPSTDPVSALWTNGKTDIVYDTAVKPVISNIAVVPATLTQNGKLKLDITEQSGVGFFGTLQGNFDSSTLISDPVIVKNIKLKNGTVNNPAVEAGYDQTLINGVLTGLANVLGAVLDPVLRGLIGNGSNIGVGSMLEGLLNARAQDPTSLATGAFAGRVMSGSTVEDCEVEGVTVTTVQTTYEQNGKIVGKGGFVGHTEGETTYSGLSNTLGAVGDGLSSLLNVIPGLGLGDLITVLLDNALPLGNLIPTGYTSPAITDCTVNNCTLSTEDGKYGVGGFAGSTCGTIITDCTVKNCGTDQNDLVINAEEFAGGFAGVSRDGIIKGTLSGLSIDIAEALHPQSELICCSIENSHITVTGKKYPGGFAGTLANSYAINDSIDADSTVTVTGISNGTDESGDCVGGFVGRAQLGSLFDMGEYLVDSSSLLSTVTGLVTGLLGTGSDQALLDLGGVAPSAVMGCQLLGELTVSSGGSYVGGVIGKGDGVYLTSSSQDDLRLLAKYKRGRTALPITAAEARGNYVADLVSVTAGGDYAGGIAGYLTSANVGGLLGSTLGLGQYLGFTVADTTVHGTDGGYTVSAGGDCAGGGIGWAVGGDVRDTELEELLSVTANNRAAGFVGATGPGDLVSGEGLDLTLLGISLLSIDNLLSVVSGVRTTYERANVTGVDDGFTVSESGRRAGNDTTIYTAGGFAAEANSVTVDDCHVYKLLSVTANSADGIAGGFVARSAAGGLAGVIEDGTTTLSVAQLGQLLDAIPYLIPAYNGCDVTYVSGGYVQGDIAGGFTGDFQSGKVNTDTLDANGDPAEYETGQTYTSGIPADPYAVNNIDHVTGSTYGGGFGGKVYSGALVSAGGGLNLLGGMTNLSINLSDLVSLVDAYVPIIKYAGVNSPNGFTVTATELEDDPTSGSAGGFIGYASGAQVSYSDVNKLKHTVVVPPDDLEAVQAPSYFDGSSSYAVTGGRYAGGYVGNMDIGTAASLGDGLKLLGNNIQLTNVLSALSVVITTIEHSDVYGAPGGFAIYAEGDAGSGNNSQKVGMSGGFAGAICGGHTQDSNSYNFSYIIGQEAAGGYVGSMEPGSVADLLDDGSVLSNIVDIDSVLAALIEDFVPTIRNSVTTCIPCGGAVRAQAASDASHQRGCAGGYCGHNEGGHIWGNNDDPWKDENDSNNRYNGEKSDCSAIRVRSVYGYEYAGGFTGFMESADTSNLGGISILNNLVSVGNLVSLLEVVYPTEKNTAVYGPMEQLDVQTWNAWVTYVGRYGGYGAELARSGSVSTQAQLDAVIDKYIYGYNAVAGRSEHVQTLISEGGDAGGYVGLMRSGVITNGQAYDAKVVRAMRCAGGYAGSMQTGGAANLGSVSLFNGNIDLNLGELVDAAEVFVPTVRTGSVRGWQSGLTVTAFGTDFVHKCGYAGGYAGSAYGAQIWGDRMFDDSGGNGCNVSNLRFVRGNNAAGGYAGLTTAASAANVNTNASNGLMQGILNTLVSQPGDLAHVLQATVTTVRQAQVDPDNADFGFVVEGVSGTPPRYAGGFAGILEATVVGEEIGDLTGNSGNTENNIVVNGLRSVDAVYYAGGFFGLADVTGVADVSDTTETHILGELLDAGEVSVIDAFRSYVYYSEVNGVDEGIIVRAHSESSQALLNETRHTGCAGGFGGAMMNGTVKHSKVTDLNTVCGLNYTGGFIGHMGKSGVVDADNINAVSDLVGLTAGVFDIFSTHTENCEVQGIDAGVIIRAAGGAEPIAGGFVGYADVSKIKSCKVEKLKQVYSDEIAGGFVGKTDMHYLVEAQASSPLVQAVLFVLNELVKALYVPQLERINLINIGSGSNILGLRVLSDGDVLYVNLLGLRIGVSLVKSTQPGVTDTALITIGDSSVALPCNEQGIDWNNEDPEVVVNLIKGNRTRIEGCSVKGVDIGYDVYGGGAGNDRDGSGNGVKGSAGGFVGFNNEGKLLGNSMEYCDVVRGAPRYVGPFSGNTSLQSVYSFNTLASIEGENNRYPVYRRTDLDHALTDTGQQIGGQAVTDSGTPTTYNRFDITHLASPIIPGTNDPYYEIFERWKDAILASDAAGSDATPIDVYASSAKAVLMLDKPTAPNDESLIPNPGESKDPCEDTIDLTVQKIWDDWNDFDGARPDAIRIRILQHWKNADGTNVLDEGEPKTVIFGDDEVIPDLDTDGWFTLTKADHAREGSSTWTRVIEGLPVYTTVNGGMIYFEYTVEEEAVTGYDTSYSYDMTGATATATVRNTHRALLPITGAFGEWILMISGIGMIILGVVMFRKKKTSSKLSTNLTFRPPRGQPRGQPKGDPTGSLHRYTRGSPRGHPRGSPVGIRFQTGLSNISNKSIKKGTFIMTKRIFAVLMAVAIMLTMTLTAFAETNKADLTVSGENLAGKDVTVVNIFSDTSQTTDTNPNYVLRDAWKPFFADELGIQSNDPDISTKAYRYVVAMQDDSADLIALAEAAREYYVEQKATNPTYFITETHQEADANDTATFTDLNAGMYLVLPEGGSTSADRGTDAMIVTIRNSDIDMDMKSVYPKVEKGVKPATAASNAPFTDDTSASVGDYVQFQLVSTVPEMSDYTTYIFKFKDTLSTGLTLDKTNAHPMTLTIGSETLVENTDYTFTQDGQSFVVAITDLKGLEADTTKNISVGDTITLTYYAELNANAVIGTAGNANSATVEYSNDPSSATETDESNPDVSKVYTYEIEINKFSRDGADEVALSGAKFEIYNTAENTANRAPIQLIATAANTYRVATPQEIADTTVTKVTEVTTPSDGKIKIDGLNLDTTYYLKETEAPTGYNQLTSEVTVVISTDNSATAGTTENNYASVYYTVSGTQNNSANDNKVKIENRPGSMLPTTGSIGTIGLTIAGVAIVIFGILVTSRKKKAKKAE